MVMFPQPSPEEMPQEDLDFLTAMLNRVKGGHIPDVEALDGFLAALVICPDLVAPSEYLNVITRGETEAGDLVFEDTREAEHFFGAIADHWNRLNRTYSNGNVQLPVLMMDENGDPMGNSWARGFIRGTSHRLAEWQEIANTEQYGGFFKYLWMLAYEDHPEYKLRSNKTPFSREQREAALAGMIAGAMLVFDFFRSRPRKPKPMVPFANPTSPAPYDAASKKVGRNDPCPCGSGQKFKKCCGATSVH